MFVLMFSYAFWFLSLMVFVRQAIKGLPTYVLKGTDYKVATSGGSESLYVG